jgi:hypothetical protein
LEHYLAQMDLTEQVVLGQQALARGDRAVATRLLSQALRSSERQNNGDVTRLLSTLLASDNGTVRLDEDKLVASKTLALRASRTSRLS